jgi:hypothetical protein
VIAKRRRRIAKVALAHVREHRARAALKTGVPGLQDGLRHPA